MTQRIITALILIAIVLLILFSGGIAIGLATMLCICFATWEVYRALKVAGHRPVSWPTWVSIVCSVPLTYYMGTSALGSLLVCAALATLTCVLFREEPKL